MADTRKKLIELLKSNQNVLQAAGTSATATLRLADHLISNGVTVQKWIAVTEEMPEKDVCVLALAKRNPFASFKPTTAEWVGNGWVNTITETYMTVSHWMPIPEPPKEDKV